MNIDNYLKPGYKKTPVGIIPEDWEVRKLGEIGEPRMCKRIFKNETNTQRGVPFFKIGTFGKEPDSFISEELFEDYKKKYSYPKKGDILISAAGTIGRLVVFDGKPSYYQDSNIVWIENDEKIVSNELLFFIYSITKWQKTEGGIVSRLYNSDLKKIHLPIPPKQEQKSIANCLSTWDSGIEKLTQLIQAKKLRKKGLMQQLLTGKKRLAGFDGKWKEVRLGEIAYCLDNLRVPLNSEERDKMKGEIPYCGANGVIDYVNDFVIDDDIILMAEDGGYFDEYETRPIAYRMKGKCWVNNHAHILKAKENFNHSFLFYSLVHKNVIPYISGGTRAKLNKKHLLQIKINAPVDSEEQTAIANILQTADREIEILEQKLSSLQEQKKGLMQVLLTGEKRLVDYK